MPYKRNPMRAERVCSLARHLITLSLNPGLTAATQWLERTLDDSANRRLSIAEGFLCADAILRVLQSIVKGLIVNEAVIRRNLVRELPFLVTEEILMAAVRAGGDRQELHERLRVHARAVVEHLKGGGERNDLIARLASDPAFGVIRGRLESLVDPARLVGRAPEQVQEFVTEEVRPLLAKLPVASEAEEIQV
jgi:adenylosuccinate lyase